MPRRRSSLLLMLCLALPAAAPAQTLPGKVAQEFRDYQRKAGARAFAWDGAQGYAYFWDAPSVAVAEEYALKFCKRRQKRGAPSCRIIDSQPRA